MNFKKIFLVLILLFGLQVSAFAVDEIDGDGVRFRSGPSTSSEPYCEFSKGTKITVRGTCNTNWYEVEYNGQIGYVWSDYVKVGGVYKSVTDIANSLLGTPYVWGGETTAGFDCSGFVKYCFQEAGKITHRVAQDIATDGYSVTSYEVGDVLCFGTSSSNIYHVGIYIGGGQFIHSSPSTGVTITNLTGYSIPLIDIRRI